MNKKLKIILIVAIIVFSIILLFGVLKIQNYILKKIYIIEYSEYVYKYSEENDIDPMLTFAIIKAESNFNRNIKMPVAEAIVAAAGPIMNFILAIIFGVIYVSVMKFAPMFIFTQVGGIVIILLRVCISINIGLGIFNLIPLPPLDGSKILAAFLPYNAKNWLEKYYNVFYIVFVVIWVTGIAGNIISPVISAVDKGLIYLITKLFGM